jgi:hypothetical protein
MLKRSGQNQLNEWKEDPSRTSGFKAQKRVIGLDEIGAMNEPERRGNVK